MAFSRVSIGAFESMTLDFQSPTELENLRNYTLRKYGLPLLKIDSLPYNDENNYGCERI